MREFFSAMQPLRHGRLAPVAAARAKCALCCRDASKEEPMASRRLPDAPKPADPALPAEAGGGPRPVRGRKSTVEPAARVQVTAEARRALIAESAYLRAERRRFAPGHEVQDWLAAEAEVDELLRAAGSSQ
jgi:DUF2934 family protein